MHVRLRLDIGWWDLVAGFIGGLTRGDAQRERSQLEQLCAPRGNVVVCLSVRTALDLFLQARPWPARSEVLCSALNLPEMARVVAHHGLVAVPIDHDLNQGLPTIQDLEVARTPRTRAILVAHLFGMRGDLGPLVEYARRHNLAIIEDCAQAFAGRDERGHPEADASLFSFGPIKTATALGGAVAYVKNHRTVREMRRLRDEYPRQSSREFLRRVLRTGVLKLVSSRPCFAVLARVWRWLGKDLDPLLHSAVKNLPPGDLLLTIRRQCSLPQVRLLSRRLRGYRRCQVVDRTAAGRRLAAALPARLQPIGGHQRRHSFWVFPVRVKEPQVLIDALRRHGFDATARTSMAVIPPPPDGAHRPAATRVSACFEELVFLPCHACLDRHTVARLATAACSGLASEESASRESRLSTC